MNVLPIRKSLEKEPGEHLSVLLTLATRGAEATEGACPAPEKLAALIEGRLPSGQRAGMLEHLDLCSDCYRAWLGTAALQPPRQVGQVVLFRRPLVWPTLAALALAAGLLLVWMPWNPFAPDVAGMLTQAYQTALLQGGPRTALSDMPLALSDKGKTLALGFANTQDPVPIRQAFVTGVALGWEELHGRATQATPSVAPEWLVYHHLGRWTILLQTLCQTTPPPSVDLLRQQAPLGAALGALLDRREATGEAEARIPRRELEFLNQLLNTSASAEPAHRLCRQIREACATITEGLAL
ncbi:MAG: hypothetical protein HQL95_00040 [Magnetococcales bacterium]|nr:hypothetical protein [Magnetococcales bacterium]